MSSSWRDKSNDEFSSRGASLGQVRKTSPSSSRQASDSKLAESSEFPPRGSSDTSKSAVRQSDSIDSKFPLVSALSKSSSSLNQSASSSFRTLASRLGRKEKEAKVSIPEPVLPEFEPSSADPFDSLLKSLDDFFTGEPSAPASPPVEPPGFSKRGASLSQSDVFSQPKSSIERTIDSRQNSSEKLPNLKEMKSPSVDIYKSLESELDSVIASTPPSQKFVTRLSSKQVEPTKSSSRNDSFSNVKSLFDNNNASFSMEEIIEPPKSARPEQTKTDVLFETSPRPENATPREDSKFVFPSRKESFADEMRASRSSRREAVLKDDKPSPQSSHMKLDTSPKVSRAKLSEVSELPISPKLNRMKLDTAMSRSVSNEIASQNIKSPVEEYSPDYVIDEGVLLFFLCESNLCRSWFPTTFEPFSRCSRMTVIESPDKKISYL